MPTTTAIKDARKKVSKQLRQLDAALGTDSAAERMRRTRAVARDLQIPDVLDPARREECEADDLLWLATYCPSVFYSPFTKHQEKIVADCGEALKYGTTKCKAAPRGDGKTSIVKYLALKYALCRQVSFPLIIAATSSKGKKALSSIKRHLASPNESPLQKDYPLECHAARYVDPWPSRARNVTANGERPISVEWGADWFTIPTWSDEEPLGPILMSLGVTSDDLQGCNVFDRRPDFVMLDDLDSRDSLAAEDGVVAAKIEEAIDKTISGLGGQSRGLGQFLICTITSRESAAYKYSDPKQKPAWSGERIPAVEKWPKRADMWEQYIELRQSGKSTLDEEGNPSDVFGREAHTLYLKNREAMDEGAVISNPHNFVESLLPDGTQTQVSSLQRCYDFVADTGMESFLTEHQNDPPENTAAVDSGITARGIQVRLSGLQRGVVPPNCTVVTQGIDVQKAGGYFVVKAWLPDATCYVIDYGFHDSHGTRYGSDEGLELSIVKMIEGRMETILSDPYIRPDGEIVDVGLTFVDAGWWPSAVYEACRKIGLGIYPTKGHGKSSGCTGANFSESQRKSKDRKPGDGWFQTRIKGKQWLVNCDTDRWKAFEHQRWMTTEGNPGAAYIHGEMTDDERRNLGRLLPRDSKEHFTYAQQVVAEVETEEVIKGTLRRRWKTRPGHSANHYLDASYLADTAARMLGIQLLAPHATAQDKKQRKTLSQMANGK